MGLLPGYKKCFFCGPATGGLALELQYADGAAFCEFTADERFQGYDGMLHGGIVTGILDEVMWWTLFMETGMLAATWKIDVEFRRPILCRNEYRVSGNLVGPVRAAHHLAARIEDASGKTCAAAKGFFRRNKGITLEDLAGHLDFRGVPQEIRSLFHSSDR